MKDSLIGVTTRIRNLNDRLMLSGRNVYKLMGLDIQPNWHMIFLLIEKNDRMTVTEMSQELNISHPAVIKIVHKMRELKYLDSCRDENDSRKQLLSLSSKAILKLPVMKKQWEIITQVHSEYISETFLNELTNIENRLNTESIENRIIKHLNI